MHTQNSFNAYLSKNLHFAASSLFLNANWSFRDFLLSAIRRSVNEQWASGKKALHLAGEQLWSAEKSKHRDTHLWEETSVVHLIHQPTNSCFPEVVRPEGGTTSCPPAVLRKGCRWCNPLLCLPKNMDVRALQTPTCVAFNELIVLHWSQNPCKAPHCFVQVLNLLRVSSFQNWGGKEWHVLVRWCWRERYFHGNAELHHEAVTCDTHSEISWGWLGRGLL